MTAEGKGKHNVNKRKVTYNVSKESGEAFDSQPFSHLRPFNLDYKQHKQSVTALAPLSKNAQGKKQVKKKQQIAGNGNIQSQTDVPSPLYSHNL